jgi:hypothetical protein
VTLADQEILKMVDAVLDAQGVPANDRARYLRDHGHSSATLRAIAPLTNRYLAIVDPPRMCQIEHDHWEGKMICDNPLPCRTHGGR